MLKPHLLILVPGLLNIAMSDAQVLKSKTESTSVMIDGKFQVEEWADAVALPAGDSLTLYLKHDRENIYLCVRGMFRRPVLGGIDLYVEAAGLQLNLHASAKLGERLLQDGAYGDYTWWNNDSWIANVVRIERFEDRKFLMDECKEFQLSRSRFKGNDFRLAVVVSVPDGRITTVPPGASPLKSTGWLQVDLR